MTQSYALPQNCPSRRTSSRCCSGYAVREWWAGDTFPLSFGLSRVLQSLDLATGSEQRIQYIPMAGGADNNCPRRDMRNTATSRSKTCASTGLLLRTLPQLDQPATGEGPSDISKNNLFMAAAQRDRGVFSDTGPVYNTTPRAPRHLPMPGRPGPFV